MRKILLSLWCSLALTLQAAAGVPCVLPFTLTNATLADATQVQANFQALVNCLSTGAAALGVNSDITALSGLTTPVSPAQGGSTVYAGGVSTGAANAQVLATTVPINFALITGYQVNFTAGFTNTGPTTIAVGGQAAKNVYRQTDAGVAALAGGEIYLGKNIQLVFDGTQFEIVSPNAIPVGTMWDYAGTTGTPPPGWLLTDGSCQLRTTYPALFAAISTVYDVTAVCDVNHFAVPDYRGRVTAYKDNMGGSTASRITVAGGNFDGTVVGGVGGQQNKVVAQANLPSVNFAVTGNFNQAGIGSTSARGDAGVTVNVVSAINQTATALSGVVAASGGSGTALPVLSPTQIAQKIIKF